MVSLFSLCNRTTNACEEVPAHPWLMEASSDPARSDEAIPPQFEPRGRDAHIDIDTSSSNVDTDTDSAIGSDTGSTGSTSITSSIRNYVYENGRRYHAYREGKYLLPNDETEQDRLDLQHHVYSLLLGGRLCRAPIGQDAQRVLDYGTGTGIWAIMFADEHPHTHVIGNDLSPIQPGMIPPNCQFYIDDVESEWVYGPDEAFDFIHGRTMCGSIADWDALHRNCFNHLVPGGWAEQQDFEALIWQIDDPECKSIQNITKWLNLIDEASSKMGKRINVISQQKENLEKAGFINVHDDIYPVPIGTWPKDKKLKELGFWQREHMVLCVEAFTLALFTRILQWSVEETQIMMAKVTNELRDPKNHLICYFHYVYGQKPPLSETETHENPTGLQG